MKSIKLPGMKTFRITWLILLMLLAASASSQDVCEIDDNQVLIFGLTHEGIYVLGLEWIHDPNGSPDMFRAKVGDYPVVGSLEFENDKLVGCEYVFEIDGDEPNKYARAYFQIKSLLSEKYGQPADELEYLTGKYRGSSPQSNKADLAIAHGSGYYRSQWRFDDGPRTITLRLSAGKDRDLKLVYRHFRPLSADQQDYTFP